MLFPLLLVGSLWFWVIIAFYSILVIWALEHESGGWATVESLILIGLLCAFTNFNPFTWIVAHPALTGAAVAGWFVAGTGWAVAKWYFFASSISTRYKRARDEWLKTHKNIPKDGETGMSSWGSMKRDYLGRHSHVKIPLKVNDHKGRIMTWMMWWPWSAVWTIINDPVRRIFTSIYYRIGNFLQGMSDRMFKFDELNEDPPSKL